MNETITEFEEQRRQLLDQLQQVAIRLSTAIASRVIHQKIAQGDFAVEQLARAAVRRLGEKTRVVVRLHPDDLRLLIQRIGDNAPLLEATETRLEADPSLARGDCKAEAGDISVWSQVEFELEEISQHLTESLTDAEIERRKAVPGDHNLRRFPDRRQTA